MREKSADEKNFALSDFKLGENTTISKEGIIESDTPPTFELSAEDIIEIRKIFNSTKSATKWEEKVLIRLHVLENKNWINRNISGFGKISKNAFLGQKHTQATKRIMSQKATGRIGPMAGRIHTTETRKKIQLNNPNRRDINTPEGIFLSAEAFANKTKKITANGFRNLLSEAEAPRDMVL